MVSIYLPPKFINETSYDDVIEGKLVRRKRVVESDTGPIQIDYSGPLGESFSKEALAQKKRLSINPGQTIEVSETEAKFLTDRYPFLTVKNGELGRVKELPEVEVIREVMQPAKPIGLDISEAPTNFMQLKKWATEKGVEVLKSDNKETILEKLSQKPAA